jgi:hypothetical protein
MSTKQGQPNAGGSRKQEGEDNQAKRNRQQDQAGEGARQAGAGSQKGPLPGSQKDRKGKIGQ